MNNNSRNLMLDAWAAQVDFVSLHDGWPGAAGANEISGGAPVYSRSAVAWLAAAGGSLSADGQPSFNIPPGASISWAGFWSDETSTLAADYYGAVPLGSGVPVLATALGGTDFFTAPGHPFVNGKSITMLDTLGSLPAGITEGAILWVRDATTDAFKVSATEGGSAIDLTTSGVAKVYKIVEETYNGQGLHTFTDVIVEVA